MILPIRTSITPRKTPYVNYALIIINAVIFLLSYHPHYEIVGGMRVPELLRTWAQDFMLTPQQPHIWQFVTYAFLHANLLHVGFNMFFLYIFGNNVNDKLGNIGYTCFYLAGAVFSAIGHILLATGPADVMGASGAVAAVTGAYLVLFPRTLITVVYWIIFIGTIEVPAIYFIAVKMIIIDNVLYRTTENVAYDAHLSGYAFGILTTLALLAANLVSTSGMDLWTMIKQWNRRRKYNDVVSSGYNPFTGLTEPGKIKVKAKEIKKSPKQLEKENLIKQIRNDIVSDITKRDFDAAAQNYQKLMDIDPTQVLPKQNLLDIANHLNSRQNHELAANAYEQFLKHYHNYEYAHQVQLMLGLIYARYLDNPKKALEHLEIALEKLTDPGQVQMCQQQIDQLKQ